jgi:hypothetical protein
VIKFAMLVMKIAVLAAIVLVLGQISVGNQRIHDHVRDVVQHGWVQGPVRWISDRVNFLEGHHATASNTDHAGAILRSHAKAKATPRAAGSEHEESDKARLSGLLKR